MIATSKHFKTSSSKHHSDWDFLPSVFSGTTGVIIGWAIAFVFGWV